MNSSIKNAILTAVREDDAAALRSVMQKNAELINKPIEMKHASKKTGRTASMTTIVACANARRAASEMERRSQQLATDCGVQKATNKSLKRTFLELEKRHGDMLASHREVVELRKKNKMPDTHTHRERERGKNKYRTKVNLQLRASFKN